MLQVLSEINLMKRARKTNNDTHKIAIKMDDLPHPDLPDMQTVSRSFTFREKSRSISLPSSIIVIFYNSIIEFEI